MPLPQTVRNYFLSIKSNNIHAFAKLYRKCIGLRSKDNLNLTGLLLAAWLGRTQMVQLLLESEVGFRTTQSIDLTR